MQNGTNMVVFKAMRIKHPVLPNIKFEIIFDWNIYILIAFYVFKKNYYNLNVAI